MSQFYSAIREHLGTRLLLIPAVAAVVKDVNGHVLVQQKHDLSWSLPAGAIEPGESPARAIIREVEEETGLVVFPERVVGVFGGESCRVRYPNGDNVEYVVTVFECRETGGSLIVANEETRTLAYFPPDEVPTLSLPYPSEIFTNRGPAYFDAR